MGFLGLDWRKKARRNAETRHAASSPPFLNGRNALFRMHFLGVVWEKKRRGNAETRHDVTLISLPPFKTKNPVLVLRKEREMYTAVAGTYGAAP